jgi:Na+-translocating ferredoxin:NAD+ oxidoreductase RnfA subunit
MNVLFFLCILSLLSLNMTLNFGVGIRLVDHTGRYEDRENRTLAGACLLIAACAFTFYLFFRWLAAPFGLGFLLYFLAYPVVEVVFHFLLCFCFRKSGEKVQEILPDGFGATAVLLTGLLVLRFAETTAQAAGLSLLFPAGIWLCAVLLRAIQFRVSSQSIGKYLDGLPVTLLAAGLLGMVFDSIAKTLL